MTDGERKRVVIEFSERSYADLAELAVHEPPLDSGEPLNKSTLTNRAVQVYAEIRRMERRGMRFLVMDVEDQATLLAGGAKITFVNWL